MHLHIINGFLGSGKTTAIITATRKLASTGKKVGIVTNDKGQFQVDSALMRSHNIPTRQVVGGCLRCSFGEFEDLINNLNESNTPDVIFAESVGSCVDLVNTIISPIMCNTSLKAEKTTFSVFADIRLIQKWILHETLPFSDAINYLFEKQLEEGDLLVLNKADLLDPVNLAEVTQLTEVRFPGKKIITQSSLPGGNIDAWFSAINTGITTKRNEQFTVDYRLYKKGENELAWIDAAIDFTSDSNVTLLQAISNFLGSVIKDVYKLNCTVGHIKFFIESPAAGTKISITTGDMLSPDAARILQTRIPDHITSPARMTLNARLSISTADFEKVVEDAISTTRTKYNAGIRLLRSSSYNPVMSMSSPEHSSGDNGCNLP